MKSPKVEEGMKITGNNACTEGKFTNTKNKKTDAKASAPLELVHTDLQVPLIQWLKMDISMHFHSQMIFSGAVFVYFLKNKSDTTLVTKKFLTDSAPYGRVKCGRSDNGTEYMSDAFQSLMREKGIRHETSSSILSSSKWYSRETVENPF